LIPNARTIFAILFTAIVAACQPSPGDTQARGQQSEDRELRVITSGGFAAAFDILAPQFEAETGIKLITSRGASSGGAQDSIPVRLARGEEFDVIILSRPSLDNLANKGMVQVGSRVDLVRSSIGMAVREDAPVPDISTPESFLEALLTAESIGYSASASGTYLSTVLFPELGLSEQLDPKSRRILSERVATVVARGDVQIGFQQISEILPIEGIEYVGPIPGEYQRVTTFSAGLTTPTTRTEEARALVEFLSSRRVASTIAATGLEPIVLER